MAGARKPRDRASPLSIKTLRATSGRFAVLMDLFAGRDTHVRGSRFRGSRFTSAQGLPMAGGIKRNKSSLPKGRSGVFGGLDPQPGDEQQGGWSRQQREEMDQRFTDAMARALHTGRAQGPRLADQPLKAPATAGRPTDATAAGPQAARSTRAPHGNAPGGGDQEARSAWSAAERAIAMRDRVNPA